MCSISVERSWGYCPNCNYWFGDLNDDDSHDSDSSNSLSRYSSTDPPVADTDKLGCTLGLYDDSNSGCGCAWVTFKLVLIYSVALFVLVTLVTTTVGQVLLGVAAAVTAAVAYHRWARRDP